MLKHCWNGVKSTEQKLTPLTNLLPSGHYMSDVYDMRKKSWFSFDDSHVTKISEADVKTKRERSGYIFFYMSK